MSDYWRQRRIKARDEAIEKLRAAKESLYKINGAISSDSVISIDGVISDLRGRQAEDLLAEHEAEPRAQPG